MIGAVANVAAQIVGQATSSADARAEAERQPAYTLHLVILGFSIGIMISFWASYGWSLLLAILAFTNGIIAHHHLSSLHAVKHDRCCCASLSALHNIYMIDIADIILGVIATVTSLVAVILQEDTVFRVFAAISMVCAMVIVGVSIPAFQRVSALHKICQQEFQQEMGMMMQPVGMQPVQQAYPAAQPVQYPQAQVATYPQQQTYPAAQTYPPADPNAQYTTQPQAQPAYGYPPQQQQQQQYPPPPPGGQPQQQRGVYG